MQTEGVVGHLTNQTITQKLEQSVCRKQRETQQTISVKRFFVSQISNINLNVLFVTNAIAYISIGSHSLTSLHMLTVRLCDSVLENDENSYL